MSTSGEGRIRRWFSHFLPPSHTREMLTSGQATPSPAAILETSTTLHTEPGTLADEVAKPPPVVSKNGVPISSGRRPSRTPNDIELETIEWGKRLTGPEDTSPPSPRELENNSGTASPVPSDSRQIISSIVPSVKHPYMNRWRIAACCVAFFIQGLNDSAVGALLPYMENHYHVSYAVVSLIFVANAIGFVAAAPVCHTLNNRFGRAKVLSACTILNVIAYAVIISQPPYAVVVLAFFVLGFAFATILALDNVFIVNLRGGTELLGYLHGLYGVGGIVAPFAATAMVSSGARWSYFYITSLALSLFSSPAFFWSFKGYESEDGTTELLTALERTASRATSIDEKKHILRKALKNRTTLLGALLIFAYQGAEVSISGWVISFLIDYRNGDPTRVGYVTSGFWGGITLGRFILVAPANKLGARASLIALVALTAGFQFMVWFLPNVIGNAVAVALIGFLLGPIYPCATGVFSKLLPSHLQITSLSFISSMGSSGGAIAPFFTGLLAQRVGTVVLNPICIALCVVMEIAWVGLPRVVKRTE